MKKTLAMIMALCLMLTALCSVAFADGGYQIQVVDPDGYPVKGVAVQFCSDTECRMAKTDEDGIASFDVPAGSYTIHLLKVPAGYEKDPREYVAPETPDLVTLTINQEGRPEQSVAAAGSHAKGADESEFVIGNIVGSNLFNTLAVVGLAGTISPFSNFSPYILSRDLPLMFGLSLSLSLFGLNFRNVRKDGLISRWKGAIWLLVLLAYLGFMVYQETSG